MRAALAWAALRRHRARTLLAVLGVAVSAALLLDMVMLATGMRDSFREFLMVRGFQLRVSPKGTLPFDTEATIDHAGALVAALERNPDIETVSPVLGGQLFVERGGGRVVTAFAVGGVASRQGDYEVVTGHAPQSADEAVVNDAFLAAAGAHVGDTIPTAAGFDPQLRAFSGRRTLRIVGTGRFFYTAAEQLVVALPIETLRAMGGAERADRVSLVMARVRAGVPLPAVIAAVQRADPRVTVISTDEALRQVDERLKYFRQLAFILGAISLVVGFFLVTTLVTVSVNERVGEIAVMRAIGVSRGHIVQQIVVEGLAITLAGTVAGLALGLVSARYLNAILSDFPGLPVHFSFFVFRAAAAFRSLGLLFASGVLAGAYPSWRAASLPIAGALRQEAIA